ncbi:MAG: hypothetical protein AABY22_10230 [Nanoarchaeota archaeon]
MNKDLKICIYCKGKITKRCSVYGFCSDSCYESNRYHTDERVRQMALKNQKRKYALLKDNPRYIERRKEVCKDWYAQNKEKHDLRCKENMRKLYAARKEQGLCLQCGKGLNRKGAVCISCNEKNKGYRK